MVQINDVNAQRFSLNGVEYFKNFTPIVVGTKITIVNTYDSKIVIVPLTEFQDFEVDAVTYGSVILLQTALLPVLFTRDSLGATGDFLSNDIADYTAATTPLAGTELALVEQGGTFKKVAVSEFGGGGGAASFQGDWNAETNTPTLANGTGTLGHEYKVTSSYYRFGEIFLVGDFVMYDGSVWIKSRDNNKDIATRYPLSYINTNSGSGVQNLGEADGFENAGAINADTVVNNTLTSGFYTKNTRRFRTQALANSLVTYLNASFGRVDLSMGFYSEQVVANADVSANSTSRFLYGLSGSFVIGNTDPSATTGYAIGLAADSADANVQVFVKSSNAPSTGVTKVDTGWPKTSSDTYSLKLFRDNSSDKIFYWVRNSTTGTEIKGMFTFTATLIVLIKQYRKGSGTNAIASGFHHLVTKINTQI